MLGLELDQRRDHKLWQWLKRGFDIAGVLIAIPLLIPLLGLIALAVKLDSKGPVLYTQKRLGWRGRLFNVLKFRTMHEDADQRLAEVLASDEQLAQEYHRMHKLRRDPRV